MGAQPFGYTCSFISAHTNVISTRGIEPVVSIKKSENLRMAITGQHRIRLRSQKRTKRQMGLESVRDGSVKVNETDKIPLFLA